MRIIYALIPLLLLSCSPVLPRPELRELCVSVEWPQGKSPSYMSIIAYGHAHAFLSEERFICSGSGEDTVSFRCPADAEYLLIIPYEKEEWFSLSLGTLDCLSKAFVSYGSGKPLGVSFCSGVAVSLIFLFVSSISIPTSDKEIAHDM